MKNNIHTLCKASVIPALFLLFLFCCQAAQAEVRTYDTLTAEELAQLSKLENRYFEEVRAEAVKLVTTFFDTRTIIQTFTPQAHIIRQRKRELLNDIVRYLCTLRLEQEFITHYTNRLRDDVVDYALDAMLQRSKEFRR
jgi:hypothetical protein